jgi:hypothetical protein
MLEPIWYESAVGDLEALPHWREAEQVAAAVRLYAEQGIGFVRRVLSDDGPDEYRLYVGEFYVRVRTIGSQLHVERIVRWRW